MQPLDPRVEIGRVRLRVGDLDRALSFYAGVLGFEITDRRGHPQHCWGRAATHHHIALHAGDGLDEAAGFACRIDSRSVTPTVSRSATRCCGSRRAGSPSSERLTRHERVACTFAIRMATRGAVLRSPTGEQRASSATVHRNGCGRGSRHRSVGRVARDGRLRGVDAAPLERRDPAAAPRSSRPAAEPAQGAARRHARRLRAGSRPGRVERRTCCSW